MRLIDADEVKQLFNHDACISTDTYADKDYVRELIDTIPTVDAEPIRHGHWELIDREEPRRYGCSQCKRMVWSEENYCPNCGAKMDEVTE